MMTILLYGELRRRFGRRFVLAVASPAEAVRALSVQLKGFRQYFVDHGQDAFKVIGQIDGNTHANKIEYGEESLGHPQSSGTLKIVPWIQGRGAVGRIIGGVALAVIGAVALSFGQAWGMYLIQAGVGMALGGIAELITRRPKPEQHSQEKQENKPSYAFDGATNTMGQGGPVPVGYGRVMIGSQVISVGFSTNNEISV
jgi:predicted phage tail protein